MRKPDSGWRDTSLKAWHHLHGLPFPAAGIDLPMVEYHYGKPFGLVSYQRRGQSLPTGRETASAHTALGRLNNAKAERLPFFTAVYDTETWAFLVFPHNYAARTFLGGKGWTAMTEVQFVGALYRLRGQVVPDLASFGVELAEAPWDFDPARDSDQRAEVWHGQLMSERRRNYEPTRRIRFSQRIPCTDIDLVTLYGTDNVAMVADYKSVHATVKLDSTNMEALGSLYDPKMNVPAVLIRYEGTLTDMRFSVLCLNKAASRFVVTALGTDAYDLMPHATRGGGWKSPAGESWDDVTQETWLSVLRSPARVS